MPKDGYADGSVAQLHIRNFPSRAKIDYKRSITKSATFQSNYGKQVTTASHPIQFNEEWNGRTPSWKLYSAARVMCDLWSTSYNIQLPVKA